MWTSFNIFIEFVTNIASVLFWVFGLKVCGILVSQSGIELTSHESENEVLIIGWPQKSWQLHILFYKNVEVTWFHDLG